MVMAWHQCRAGGLNLGEKCTIHVVLSFEKLINFGSYYELHKFFSPTLETDHAFDDKAAKLCGKRPLEDGAQATKLIFIAMVSAEVKLRGGSPNLEMISQ
ncbi:hypothetical protein D5086_012709 [Populus alba]|uniref:Uncharacterized protein n=1 Tax=Populus alba TaxID=43335 RepID=A0ACC4C4R7_POPAL